MKYRPYKIDEQRALVVFPKLLEAYYNRHGIFAQDNLCPSYNLPGNLESRLEQVNYHLFSIMGDSRVKSEVIYEHFKMLHEKDKRYFNPEFLASQKLPKLPHPKTKNRDLYIEDGTLEYILGLEVGVPSPVRSAIYMIKTARTLMEKYNSNPLNIFNDTRDVRIAWKRLQNEIDGYGRHLSSLFLTFLLKHDLVSFDNTNALPPKIDFHDVTLCFAFGVLKPKFKNPKRGIRRDRISKNLQDFLSYFAQKHNHNILHLDEALWILGSYVCSKFDWKECWNNCGVKEYCHTKPHSDYKKLKQSGVIIERDYNIYPLVESRVKNVGDLQDLFIPNFQDRVLL